MVAMAALESAEPALALESAEPVAAVLSVDVVLEAESVLALESTELDGPAEPAVEPASAVVV